jgi:Phosphate uptake regulator
MIIRSEKYNEIKQDLQLLAETLIKQYVLVEDLLINGWKEGNYKQFLDHEELINTLENSMLHKLSGIVIQFSPKGKDLRNIVYCHEVVIYVELVGNYLINIVNIIKEMGDQSADYKDYRMALLKYFERTKKMAQEACFSFNKEDAALANKIIQSYPNKDDQNLKTNTINTILTDFEEIPLQRQELITIIAFDKCFSFMEKLNEIAINIAKSTIFASQGDIKYNKNTL